MGYLHQSSGRSHQPTTKIPVNESILVSCHKKNRGSLALWYEATDGTGFFVCSTVYPKKLRLWYWRTLKWQKSQQSFIENLCTRYKILEQVMKEEMAADNLNFLGLGRLALLAQEPPCTTNLRVSATEGCRKGQKTCWNSRAGPTRCWHWKRLSATEEGRKGL